MTKQVFSDVMGVLGWAARFNVAVFGWCGVQVFRGLVALVKLVWPWLVKGVHGLGRGLVVGGRVVTKVAGVMTRAGVQCGVLATRGVVKGGRVVAPYVVMVLAGLAGAAVAGAVIAVMVLGVVIVLGVAVVLVYAMALGQVVVAAVELVEWLVPAVCDGAEWLGGQLVRGWIVAQPSLRVACLVITLITVKPVVDSRIQEFPTHGVVGQQSTIVD